ncbi:hypothetical protein [Pseudooceanicola sp.]|uniref:hypothetical protein n=1 Tax=Pseudooceanicola sp. TaxID=1914328 RepID=UPI0026031D87|nr:hypothetical protein [Pseudooceanicola sp.]MDF1855483.1 hypothetical protein [Pseudooceanicola sp.]
MWLCRIPLLAIACAAGLSGPVAAACSITAGEARCVTAMAPDQRHPPIAARFVAAPKRLIPPHRDVYLSATPEIPDIASYAPGQRLPERVSILINRERLGLPAPRDGWTYFRLGHEVFRANIRSRKVIDRVNDHLAMGY